MAVQAPEVLATFQGDEAFPIEWEPGEAELFWVLDDLHCPNPLSPLYFDLGGWWLTCDHMFRRFATPFAADWVAKNVNGYLYTAAIPADPSVLPEANEFQARYAPRVPHDPEYPAKMGAYLGFVLPHYAGNFLDWWRDRLRPEIERNFAYLDGYDTDAASLVELVVLFEDALDVHDRHWKIHWMLNFAQFSATMALNATVAEVKGEADPALLGRLQSSIEDRNWDSIEALWQMKEEIKSDDELREAFRGETAADVIRSLEGSERGRRFLEERLTPYRQEFGYKAIWSHEFSFPTWKESPAPIVEAVRGYLETDYDYPAAIRAVRDDLAAAQEELFDGVPDGEGKDRLRQALELSLRMNPLTPDHHFFIDQGTNARVRLAAIAIGRKLVEAGALDDPEDVFYLRYNELRLLAADPEAFDARTIVSDRRDEREQQALVPAAAVDRHRDGGGARVPVLVALGLPREVPPPAAGEGRRGARARRLARRGRGRRASRRLARRVRPGAGGRDPRLPDDESGVGRAVHEDRGARHGRRRRGGAPGRRRPRVRDPGRRRDVGRDRADQER